MFESSRKHYDIIVLGAGAAGLMCAITAGQRGKSVLVLERSNKVGKKILMSGGGRCNFTNLYVEPENYLSNNPYFCHSALRTYTQWDFISLVERHQIDYEERRHGQLFCVRSAADILKMLLDECKAASIEIRTQADVTNINQTDDHYRIEIDEISITTSSLVIATGALSIPTLGGSAFGYKVADQFHLPTLPTRAGLVPLTFSDEIKGVCERLSGISVTAAVSVADGRHPTFTEQLLFTHRGMSGPAILQISNYWTQGNELYVDLLPEIDASAFILMAKQSRGASLLRTVISEKLPRSLVMELQTLYWSDSADRPLAEITDLELNRIGKQLNRWTLKPSGTEGYRTAEVTLCGVNCDYLNAKTFASKQNPSLFFIGEVVDVTGHLGGFNFQWAWSSGYCAGLAA